LKYRCPAAVYGFECKGCEECSALGNVNSKSYGRIYPRNAKIGHTNPFKSNPDFLTN